MKGIKKMKNNIKKLCCLLLAFMLIFSFVACGEDKKPETPLESQHHPDGNKTSSEKQTSKLENFIEEYDDEMEEAFITGFKKVPEFQNFEDICDIDVGADENGEKTVLVINLNLDKIDIDKESLLKLQTHIKSINLDLIEKLGLLDSIKDELGISSIKITINAKDSSPFSHSIIP